VEIAIKLGLSGEAMINKKSNLIKMDQQAIRMSEETGRQLIDALLRLDDTINRQIESNSILTHIVTTSKEISEQKATAQKRKKETIKEIYMMLQKDRQGNGLV